LSRPTDIPVAASSLSERIETLGRDLRGPLLALVEELGGNPPRPSGLIRAVGIDKSPAGRIVRAVRAHTDLEFMHLVPSPNGLRILLDRAQGTGRPELLAEIAERTEKFRQLLDSTPGGRHAIDAQISESSGEVRDKAEHAAKQSAFKSMSFLLGHFCETMASSLFIVPSKNGKKVDGIEVTTRIGVQRMRPNKSLSLLGLLLPDEIPKPGELRIESLSGGAGMLDFMLREFSSDPLPELEVKVDGPVTTFVLAGDPSGSAPKQLTSAFVIRNGYERHPQHSPVNLRGYVLMLPTRTVIRDVYLAEDVFPSAIPSVGHAYPMPGGFVNRTPEGEIPDFASLDLNVPIEHLPSAPTRHRIRGIPNHPALIQSVLETVGHEKTSFRGWRCTLSYPVPFAEMVWSVRLPELG
jgi:hypothetical protein